MTQDEEKAKQYAARWIDWVTMPVGAGWAFAVGIIEQGRGGRFRVRVAKGKIKAVKAGELPITQQAKFNLKPSDWPALRDAIDLYIARLDAGGVEVVEEDYMEAERKEAGAGWEYLRNRKNGKA